MFPTPKKAGGYEALNKLLSSGIPGMEGLFSGDGKENFSARYAKGHRIWRIAI